MIRVLIVADSPIMQMGLEAIVRTDPELLVVGSGDRVTEAQLQTLGVEVLLLSIEFSEETLAAVTPLLEQPISVVWLVEPLTETLLLEAERLGVLGLLPNDATAAEIVATIEATAAGLVVFHPEIASLLRNPVLAPQVQTLTQREIEILRLLAEGMANKTIARQLYISEHTVKFHISSIFTKLSVSSRTEAVTIGIRQGLILL